MAQEAQAWKQPGTTAGQEIAGPDGGTLVWVPAGEYDMGAADHPSWGTVHHVRITRGFWLGKCEVTAAQYAKFCAETGEQLPPPVEKVKQGGVAGVENQPGGADAGKHPVVNVTWDDAVAYCTQYGVRLPTEAQWEYAARGPEGRLYTWGNEWDSSKCCNRDNTGPGGMTSPVGSLPAGAGWCGALDMIGNVYEYCSDWYDDSYYDQSPADDPQGPASGMTTGAGVAQGRHVIRGGSWLSFTDLCRADYRMFDTADAQKLGTYGFRVCATP
jgi:iron(II)-dependent oxidoreductase